MAETWILNSRIDDRTSKTFRASFISAGNSYSLIDIKYVMNQTYLFYGSTNVYWNGSWGDEAYRTVVFDTAPTGDLLTWLQAHGTKQSEPEPPEPTTPKNACLIDGTAYSIKSGKTLINGTVYTIKKGRTLLDATTRNIVLTEDKKIHTITITGILYNKSCVKTSTATYSTTGSFEVEDGETITVVAGSKRSSYLSSARVYLNGTKVAQGQNAIGATYSMTVTSDVKVEYRQKGTGVNSHNWAYITT